jgi:outer membrane protein assembly factor BamB
MITALYSLATLLFIATPTTADEWTQFRGPTGDGMSTAMHVPVNWTAAEHVVWKQPIPGSGWSSPVLSRGKLYLTTAVEESPDVASLRALCVNATDGKILWKVELFKPDAAAVKQHHSKNGVASPTPLLAGDRLYCHFGHLGTAALDLSGKVLWRQTELSYKPRHGNAGSPVVVGDLLIFSCDAAEDPFVVGLDRNSGDIRWKTPRNTTAVKTFSFSTPTVIENGGATQVVSPGSGFVAAYNPQDGKELWKVRYGEGYSVVPRPVFANGLLFLSSGFERPTLLAINPKGATGDATDTHVAWSATKGAPLTPSMLVVGEELYAVADNGVATCFDSRTGKVHWTQRLGGNFSASPVFADGRIYYQSEEGVTHVVHAGKEYKSVATNDIEERTLATLVPADGAIFMRSESHLWRIGN